MELEIIWTPTNFALVIIKDGRDLARISNIHLYPAKQKMIDTIKPCYLDIGNFNDYNNFCSPSVFKQLALTKVTMCLLSEDEATYGLV